MPFTSSNAYTRGEELPQERVSPKPFKKQKKEEYPYIHLTHSVGIERVNEKKAKRIEQHAQKCQELMRKAYEEQTGQKLHETFLNELNKLD